MKELALILPAPTEPQPDAPLSPFFLCARWLAIMR